MIYALGRSLEYYDMPGIRAIVRDAKATDYRFSSIVMGIVNAPAFRSSMVEMTRGRASAGTRRSHVRHQEAPDAPHGPSGSRRHARPPAARRDDSGRTALAQTAAKTTPHVGFIYFPHGAVMNKWTPASEGADRRARRHPEAAGQVQVDDHGVLEHRQPGADRSGACPVAGHVAVGRPSGDQPGAARRHHHRPDRRAAHRSGHAAAVARGRDRRPRRRRILRPRLRLLLRRHDFVPFADHAAADGDRSAQAVHPPVRSGRQRRGARAPVEAVRVAARHAHGRGQRAAAQPRAVGQAGAVRLPRDRPRNRAPHSEDGGARSVARRHPRRAGGHAALRSAHQPDVRPGRAGVSGEHDARLHAS